MDGVAGQDIGREYALKRPAWRRARKTVVCVVADSRIRVNIPVGRIQSCNLHVSDDAGFWRDKRIRCPWHKVTIHREADAISPACRVVRQRHALPVVKYIASGRASRNRDRTADWHRQ